MRFHVFTRLLLAAGMLSGCLAARAETPMPVSFADVQALAVAEIPERQAYGEQDSQFGELWLPAMAPVSADGHPVVVLLHGGCWLREYDIGHIRPLAAALSDAGYAVWALEYRRVGESGGGWPGTFADVALGIDRLPALAPGRLDLTRVALVGHSAGGHLALWAAARENFSDEHPHYHADPFAPRGVIGLAAITDLPSYARGGNSCQQVTPRLMGGRPEDVPERYHQASPHSLAITVPVMLLQGAADAIVPRSQALAIAGAGLREVPDAGHFDLIHPGTPAFSVLVDALSGMLTP